jgi:hypothetical protein
VGASTYMRDLELMAPEMEKQKELLAEFARNNADLELEYKVRQIIVLHAPSFALTLPFLSSRTVLSSISPYHPFPKTHSHSSHSSSFLPPSPLFQAAADNNGELRTALSEAESLCMDLRSRMRALQVRTGQDVLTVFHRLCVLCCERSVYISLQ